MLQYVTGSAKTRHNGASLNFQYRLLITIGEIFALMKKVVKSLNNLFFVKKWCNDKNLDIILFDYSRGV